MAKTEKKLPAKKEDSLPFNQAVLTKKVKNTDDLMLFKCECGSVHFRHAGYLEALTPYMSLQPEAGPQVKSSTSSLPVKVCIQCKKSYVDYLGKMQDVTDHIDLKAWEKAEKELEKASGPGGEC